MRAVRTLARLDAALAQTHIVGLNTNVQFLRNVVQSRAFASADLDTALIPREAASLFKQDKVGRNTAVAAAVAHTLQKERARSESATPGGWRDPFAAHDAWQPYALTQRRFGFEYGGKSLAAALTYLHDGALQLQVDGDAQAQAFAFGAADPVDGLTFLRTANSNPPGFTHTTAICMFLLPRGRHKSGSSTC